MSDPKTRALELVDELANRIDDHLPGTLRALRLAITQIPTTHTWVPIAECGELADGEYLTLNTPAICDGSGPFKWHRRIEGGRFPNGVIAVLSPHLGPIPEAK